MNTPDSMNCLISEEKLKLKFRKYGENGHNFVVLHGLFGSGRNWHTFAISLKEKFKIWTLDARNHGGSFHSISMSYQEMAEDVISFFNKNGLEKVILLGHSMGGKIAMQVALSFPKRILALIVADISPVKYTNINKQHQLVKFMRELKLPEGITRSEIEKILAKKIKDKRLCSFMMTNLIFEKNKFKWRIGLDGIGLSLLELYNFPLQENIFLGPTKFICADNSDYIIEGHHQMIRSLFPKSSITTIKESGHWLHFEKPDAFKKIIEDFLQKNGL